MINGDDKTVTSPREPAALEFQTINSGTFFLSISTPLR